mgnify:CR=1 FL=1
MEQEQFKKEILPLREKLFLYARRLLDNPEDAEDVMQEVFLKLWYMRGELDYYNNVMALSVQITKHLCLNRMKSVNARKVRRANNSLSAMLPRLIPSWNKKTVWSM